MMPSRDRKMPEKSEARTLANDPAARDLVREAPRRMYKWSASFRGYRAVVTLNDEERVPNGTVRLIPRKDTTVERAGADSMLQEWVRERRVLLTGGRLDSSHYVMTYFALDGQAVVGMERSNHEVSG